jgi:hypothetical protein
VIFFSFFLTVLPYFGSCLFKSRQG